MGQLGPLLGMSVLWPRVPCLCQLRWHRSLVGPGKLGTSNFLTRFPGWVGAGDLRERGAFQKCNEAPGLTGPLVDKSNVADPLKMVYHTENTSLKGDQGYAKSEGPGEEEGREATADH